MSKKIVHVLPFAVGIITLFAVVFYSSACKKNKDCKATVTLSDASLGGPVPGATVTLSPTQTAPQGNLTIQTQIGVTDNTGSVSFTFKLPAILNVAVTTSNPPYSGATFNGLVKLEEGKSVIKTMKVY